MRVGTPVATMGIRGTYVNVNVHADNGAFDVSVMAQGDQLTHSVVVNARPTPEDIAAGRTVGAQLGIITNNDGVFSFIPTPNGILVQETGKDDTTVQSELVLVQNVTLMKQLGEAILAQLPLPHGGGATGGTQITTTFPTDVSLTSLVVNVTSADTGGFVVTEIHTLTAPPPPPGIPAPPLFNPPAAHPPVVAHQIADQSSPEDTAWSFQVPAGTFTDADGDALTFTATLADGKPLPSWLTFNSATMTFSGTPPENFNGVLDLKVTAIDGAFLTADTFKLNITPVNDRPVIHSRLRPNPLLGLQHQRQRVADQSHQLRRSRLRRARARHVLDGRLRRQADGNPSLRQPCRGDLRQRHIRDHAARARSPTSTRICTAAICCGIPMATTIMNTAC